MLKRGYVGTFHKMSLQHLQRYVTEFEGKHNIRDADTIAQMQIIAFRMVGKRLKYRDSGFGIWSVDLIWRIPLS